MQRSYRCKDWHFAAVARQVDSPAFRERLVSDTSLDERAECVPFALDHGDHHITRVSYQRWLQRPR